jgi:FHS family L-fucose permease-like MFS transporter
LWPSSARRTASSRLNLAQGFNSLGTTLAPLIGGAFIFDLFKGDAAVRWPYAFFALLLVLQAVWVHFTALPEPPHSGASARQHALRHRQLRNGMGAIFCYVGAEVAIGSLIIGFLELKGVMGLPHNDAKNYLSLYWGGAMCGRFLGAVALGGHAMPKRLGLMAMIAAAMFLLLWSVNRLGGGLDLTHLWPMAVLIVANMTVFLLAGHRAGRVTGIFALAALALVLLVMGPGRGQGHVGHLGHRPVQLRALEQHLHPGHRSIGRGYRPGQFPAGDDDPGRRFGPCGTRCFDRCPPGLRRSGHALELPVALALLRLPGLVRL